MTAGWLVFGIVLPAVVAGLGWIAVLAHERHLRAHDAKRTKPAE
jgi:hypothetical protein